MVHGDSDKGPGAVGARLVGFAVGGGACHAADVEGSRFDGLEEDVYVECGEWDRCVDLCDCLCESAFGVFGCKGDGGVVDDPERHFG
jgi:hypothetical protein